MDFDTFEKENGIGSWTLNSDECPYIILAFAISNVSTLDHLIWMWEVEVSRKWSDASIVVVGFGPGGGAIRPGGVDEGVSSLELERRASAISQSGVRSSAFMSMVSRASGLAAATQIGAHAYMECSA